MVRTNRIAVVLSGCGVLDGSEIHEATMTLYAIKKSGGDYVIFAPDITQYHVVNHLTGEEMSEQRNVLVESARIARGQISPLSEFNAGQYDAVIFPGGFGVAKNLSDFAFKGSKSKVIDEVKNVISAMVNAGKPIGALCISPVLLANLIDNVEVTIGDDKDTEQAITKMGGRHKRTSHGEIVIDHKYRTVTTPCYMLDANIVQVAEGAENVVKAIMKMTEDQG